MIFLKIGSIDSKYHLYDVIFTIHHSIGETKSDRILFMKLLDTIDMIHNKSHDSKYNNESKMMPSIFEIAKQFPCLISKTINIWFNTRLYKHNKLNILDNDDDENNNLDFDDEE